MRRSSILKIVMALILAALLGSAIGLAVPSSYAFSGDKTYIVDRSSDIAAPGWINETAQRAYRAVRQASNNDIRVDAAVEQADDKLSDKVAEDSADKPVLDLKKKTGGSGENRSAQPQTVSVSQAIQPTPTDSTQHNVSIGSGTDQRDINGNLVSKSGKQMVSEIIGGTRYIYAGFDNHGTSTIQQAIGIAKAGDKVIVKGGDTIYTEKLQLFDGVSIYGGYNDKGEMDSKTIFNGDAYGASFTQGIEIAGFKFSRATGRNWKWFDSQVITIYHGSNIKIFNNIFENRGFDLEDDAGQASLIENNIFSGDCGSYLSSGNWTVKNNMFQFSYYGNIYASVANIHLSNNNIYAADYGGPALYIYGNCSLYSENNNYYGNNSVWGGYAISGDGIGKAYSSNDYFANNNMSDGTLVSITGRVSAPNQPQPAKANNIATPLSVIPNSLSRPIEQNNLGRGTDDHGQVGIFNIKNADVGAIGPIFRGLLMSKDLQSGAAAGGLSQADSQALSKEVLSRFTLAAQGNVRAQDVEAAMKLANILKNPTEGQKLILDTMQTLLVETEKAVNESDSSEMKKASDDLLQMAAAVLISQAMPDLFKETDAISVKSIFQELGLRKSKIFLDYQESVKPYYNRIKDLISKNMAALQLNNVLSRSMVEDGLARMEPGEVDRILEKLRKASNKSFEEEYILQQEAKYRKTYIDPNKKVFEEQVKDMMKDFTRRLSKALEDTKR